MITTPNIVNGFRIGQIVKIIGSEQYNFVREFEIVGWFIENNENGIVGAWLDNSSFSDIGGILFEEIEDFTSFINKLK